MLQVRACLTMKKGYNKLTNITVTSYRVFFHKTKKCKNILAYVKSVVVKLDTIPLKQLTDHNLTSCKQCSCTRLIGMLENINVNSPMPNQNTFNHILKRT